MKNIVKKIWRGVVSTSLLMIPVFAFYLLINIIEIQNILHLSQKKYEIGTVIFLISMSLSYVLPVFYWIWKKNWLAFIGSAIGGVVICVILLMLGVFVSCAQGSCF